MIKFLQGFHAPALLLLVGLYALPALAQNTPSRFYNDQRILVLEISDEYDSNMQDKLVTWLEHISSALLQVYGKWPRERWQITVTPVSASHSDPIPWAKVNRGEVNEVEFYTARTASLNQLRRAWTGYHELSHLLIPYRGWGDIWFSEGLASYYQNLLQARSGVLGERQMWQKLYEGFMRGRDQTELNGQDLQSLSDNLRSNGAYMRVYWSGAWFFLEADVRLREMSDGEKTLDRALGRLNKCCSEEKMSVVEIVQKLDELTGEELFYPLYLQTIATTELPDFEQAFHRLGITIDSTRRVQLEQVGPEADLRRPIAVRKSL